MFGWKKTTEAEAPRIAAAPSPVSDALILVCEKCGKKLSGDAGDNPARALQLELKDRIKSEGRKGKVRAVITSCMDLCPDGEIAIAIARTGGPNEFFTASGNPPGTAEAVLRKVTGS